jgi:Tol biopolymer transport system component
MATIGAGAVVALLVVSVQACSFTSSGASPSRVATSQVSIPPIPASATPAGLIAFRRYTDTNLTTSQIVTAHLDGTHQQGLTPSTPGVRDSLPAWSHDGTHLAFLRTTPEPHPTAEVFVVGRSSGRVRQLTHSPAGAGCGATSGPEPAAPTSSLSCNSDPSWSPNGTTLAYSHRYQHDSVMLSEIWVTNQAGTETHALTARGQPVKGSGPSWSPDATRIAFERGNSRGTSAIFVVRADGTGEQQLTAGNLSFGDHPTWSPDGTKILFRSNPNDPTQGFRQSDLYTVHPDGTGLTKLTHSAPDLEYLSSSWSPDGQWIVTGLAHRGSHNNQAQLYLLSAHADQGRLVVDNPDWQSAPRWNPTPGKTAP